MLLLSDSPRFPDSLANGSGLVGRYLMPNGHSLVHATFDEPLNEHKSVQVTRIVMDYYETDPTRSVVDPWHRSHEVPNPFICDGSSIFTSGRGQPTMTIRALAFRAAEYIGGAARRGEI